MIPATIRNDVDRMALLDLGEFEPFQGKLKALPRSNYKKLRGQIEKLGFSDPIKVWENKGKTYILDGHQRLKTLQIMAGEGTQVPKIPAVFVKAKTKGEAKRKVLAMASVFGKMTQKSLLEYASEAGVEFKELEEFAFAGGNLGLGGEEKKKPEIEFSEFIGEMNNYVVLVFRDPIDWTAAKSFFGIKEALSKRENGKEWSRGVGRIVDGAKILKAIT